MRTKPQIDNVWIDCIPFAGAVILFFFLLAIQFPSLSYHAEMWAEGGTSFFYHAHYSDLATNLLISDLGYLSWPTRIAAVIIDRVGTPPGWVPYTYQAISLVCISFFCAFFCLPQFRRLMPSDEARFLVCCALALQTEYDVKAFINFSYYAGIPFFLAVALGPHLEDISKSEAIALSALLGVFSVSKATLLAYGPPALWLFASGLRTGKRNLCVIFGPCLAGMLVQTAVLIAVKPMLDVSAAPIPFSSAIYSIAAYFLDIVVNLLWGKAFLAKWMSGPQIALRLVGAAASSFVLYRYGRQSKNSWRIVICGLALCGLATALVVIGQSGYAVPVGAMPYTYSLAQRHWFVPTVAPFLAFAILIFELRNLSARAKTALLLLWLFVSSPFGLQGPRGDLGWAMTGYSNWAAFFPLIPKTLDGDACVPVNPYPWKLGIHCDFLAEPPDPGDVFGPALPAPASGFQTPSDIERARVRMVGLVLRDKSPERFGAVLAAYDRMDRLLGSGRLLQPDERIYSHFYFEQPVVGIHKIVLEARGKTSPLTLVMEPDGKNPVWLWYGRR